MIPSMLSAHLGLPDAAPKPKAKKGKNPKAALSAALAAHKAGDHHTAKKHALTAVNLLHRMAAPAPAAAPAPVDPAAPAAC